MNSAGGQTKLKTMAAPRNSRRGRTCIIIAVSCPVSLGQLVGEGRLVQLRESGHSLARIVGASVLKLERYL